MCASSLFSRLPASLLALNLLVVFLPSLTFPAEQSAYPIFDHFPLPKSVSLCGEPVPLENRCVWEMLDRELTVAVSDRAQVGGLSDQDAVSHTLKRSWLGRMLEDLKYLTVAESSLLTRIRSKKGAIGLWQFMAPTARRNGLRKECMIDEWLDFERSTEEVLKYLNNLKAIFGTWTLALASYNSGDVRLKRELKEQKVRDYYGLNLPVETERLIFRIAAVKIIMENSELYGYSLKPERIYRPIDCDTVPVRIQIPLHMTDVAQALGTDFKVFKELNSHILGYYLPIGHYTIKVPSGLGSRMASVLRQLTLSASRSMKKVSDGYYTVQPGDTLSHIARRTGVLVAKLKRLNGIQGSVIRVGQKLRLSP